MLQGKCPGCDGVVVPTTGADVEAARCVVCGKPPMAYVKANARLSAHDQMAMAALTGILGQVSMAVLEGKARFVRDGKLVADTDDELATAIAKAVHKIADAMLVELDKGKGK